MAQLCATLQDGRVIALHHDTPCTFGRPVPGQSYVTVGWCAPDVVRVARQQMGLQAVGRELVRVENLSGTTGLALEGRQNVTLQPKEKADVPWEGLKIRVLTGEGGPDVWCTIGLAAPTADAPAPHLALQPPSKPTPVPCAPAPAPAGTPQPAAGAPTPSPPLATQTPDPAPPPAAEPAAPAAVDVGKVARDASQPQPTPARAPPITPQGAAALARQQRAQQGEGAAAVGERLPGAGGTPALAVAPGQHVIGLTLTDAEEPPARVPHAPAQPPGSSPAGKRRRLDAAEGGGGGGGGSSGGGGLAGAGAQQSQGQASSVESQVLLSQDTPFKLMRVDGNSGILPEYNLGCMGVSIGELLPAGCTFVTVMSHSLDLAALLEEAPALEGTDMLICHACGQAHDKKLKDAARAFAKTSGRTILVHRPPLPFDNSTHHTKAIIAEYADGLRVIIPTSNFTHSDLTSKTQAIFYQDFPRLQLQQAPAQQQQPAGPASAWRNDFGEELINYVQQLKVYESHVHMGGDGPVRRAVQERLVRLLREHDFSAARVALVASVPGSHSVQGRRLYGHMRLRHLLSKVPLPGPDVARWQQDSQLVLQGNSLSSCCKAHVDWQLIPALSASLPPPRATPSRHRVPLSDTLPWWWLVWPTVEEVGGFKGGEAASESLSGPIQDEQHADGVTQRMCRWGGQASGRMRASPHIKTYGRFLDCGAEGQQLAWTVIGSHNVSKAAWGDVKGGKISIGHYELSVLTTPELEHAYRTHPHCGFCCTPHAPPGPLSVRQWTPAATTSGAAASATMPPVEFWSLPAFTRGAGSSSSGGGAQVAAATPVLIPLPYSLPPKPYQIHDKPWPPPAKKKKAAFTLLTAPTALGLSVPRATVSPALRAPALRCLQRWL